MRFRVAVKSPESRINVDGICVVFIRYRWMIIRLELGFQSLFSAFRSIFSFSCRFFFTIIIMISLFYMSLISYFLILDNIYMIR